MTKHEDDKEPAFKVVDRRRFDEDGHEKVTESTSTAASPPSAEPVHETEHGARPPMSFSLFIQTLAHQSMMGLGIVPWPDSNLIRQDLNLARETIDLLNIIKVKTLNNLDKNEEALLNGILYQLQIAYVEVANEPGKNSGGGSGSIIS